MTDIIVKIMTEVLDILAIATKEMKQSRASTLLSPIHEYRLIFDTEKYLKKLIGKKEMEDALKRLDRLTQDEARMAAAETLKLTHIVDNKVSTVLNGKPSVLSTPSQGTLCYARICRLDGKETKQIVQQLANSVDDMKCLSSTPFFWPRHL